MIARGDSNVLSPFLLYSHIQKYYVYNTVELYGTAKNKKKLLTIRLEYRNEKRSELTRLPSNFRLCARYGVIFFLYQMRHLRRFAQLSLSFLSTRMERYSKNHKNIFKKITFTEYYDGPCIHKCHRYYRSQSRFFFRFSFIYIGTILKLSS